MALIERVNLATNPSFERAATGTVATPVVRENLVSNPLPASTDDWVISSGEALNFIPDDGGAPALEMLDATGGGGGYADPEYRPEPAVGLWIAMGADVKALDADTAANMRVAIAGYNGAAIAGVSPTLPVSTTEYTRIASARQVTAMPSGGYLRTLLWPNTSTTPAGGGFRFRNAVVAVASTEADALAQVAAYMDGNTSPVAWLDPYWTGAENASTSVLVPAGATYPTAPAPLDFSPTSDADRVIGQRVGAVQSTYGAQNGMYAISSVPNSGGTSNDSYVMFGESNNLPLEEGHTYTISATAILAAPLVDQLGTRPRCIIIVTEDSVGSQSVLATSDPAPNEAGAYRVSVTFTVPTGNTIRHVRLYNGSSRSTDVMWWDDVLIEEGDVLGPYFDGDTLPPGVIGEASWQFGGEPNNSPSTLVYSTTAVRGAWGISLGDVALEGGDGIVPTLISRHGPDSIVGCLTEPPDGLGLAPRRTQDVTLAQRDGVAMLADFYENRVITIKATVGGSGCDGCPSAKANVRRLLRAWARYCSSQETLTIYTDCHNTGDVADVGPFSAIGRGRAAEVVWRPGGVQVADVTLRFDCVDHLLRFNEDSPYSVLRTVDVPVLSSFWINEFIDPRGRVGDPAVWFWETKYETSSYIAVTDAEDGFLINENGKGGMELDGDSGGDFGEHSASYYRRRITVLDTSGTNPLTQMWLTATGPTKSGTMHARAWVRSSQTTDYFTSAYAPGSPGYAPGSEGTLQADEWTLVEGTIATAAGTDTQFMIAIDTEGLSAPLDLDYGGVVIQYDDAPADLFFDGTPSYFPFGYNQPNGFGWVVDVQGGVGRYASQWESTPDTSRSLVGLEETVIVPVGGDVCVKMEVQFTGPLTAPITLVDVANNRWVRYDNDVAAGEQATLDTSTGRIFHPGGSASGDGSYALSGDTFMNLNPISGSTPEFQLWTGDMTNDTGFARIYWSDAVLGI